MIKAAGPQPEEAAADDGAARRLVREGRARARASSSAPTRTGRRPGSGRTEAGSSNPQKKQILIANSGSSGRDDRLQEDVQLAVRVPGHGLLERLRQRADRVQERPGCDDRERAVVDRGRPPGTPVPRARRTSASRRSRRGPGGKQGSPVGGNGFVISKNSKNVAAAYKFIYYLTSPRAGGVRGEEQPPAVAGVVVQAAPRSRRTASSATS